MTSYEQGAGREPDPQTATTASGRITEDADEDEPGFFALAMQGKVRPAPREPETTYYRSRWFA